VIDGINELNTLTIPRCIYDAAEVELVSCQLHWVGDASIKACCAVVYLVQMVTNEVCSCHDTLFIFY